MTPGVAERCTRQRCDPRRLDNHSSGHTHARQWGCSSVPQYSHPSLHFRQGLPIRWVAPIDAYQWSVRSMPVWSMQLPSPPTAGNALRGEIGGCR